VSALERRLAVVLHRWLVRRGWIVQMNDVDHYRRAGTWNEQVGWQPIFSVRYGHEPVYRGPGPYRYATPKQRAKDLRDFGSVVGREG
jgi:hypothetical protein